MESTCGFIRKLTQLYRRLHGRQTRILQFSSTMRGGKPAIAALPPLSSAVIWIFQISSAVRRGKLATEALPPLSSAVNLIFQFSSAVRGGKLATAALPPLPSAVKSVFQFSSALREGKLEIAFTLRVLVAEIFPSEFSSSFRFFCLLAAPGVGAYFHKMMDGRVRMTIWWLNRRMHGRQTRILQFSSTMRGGKPAIAALPPLSSAVIWIFQISSAVRRGKLATEALPPLSSAVNLIFQLSSAVRGGKQATAALPPLPSAVNSVFQFSSALRGGKLEIAFTLRVLVAEIFQSEFSSSFRFFCLLAAPGVGAYFHKMRDGRVRMTIWENNIESQ
ncbi:hypothetical protein AAC387_Pa03g0625 [Persea americana]